MILGVDGDKSSVDLAATVMTSVDATRKHIKSYIYTLTCMQCSLVLDGIMNQLILTSVFLDHLVDQLVCTLVTFDCTLEAGSFCFIEY